MFKFKISLNLLKSKQPFERGAALTELALSFPIALTIVLVTIHLSHVLRESNVVVEAARHGARSVSAASGTSTGTYEPPVWALNTYGPVTENCDSVPPTDTPIEIASVAACGYLQEYFDSKWLGVGGEKGRWKVTASIFQSNITEIGVVHIFWFVSVQLAARDNRGPVEHLRNFFGLKPEMTATFPILRVE